MKIALISSGQQRTPPVGYGSEARTWDLAVELSKLDHEVHLFASEGSYTPPGGQLHEMPASVDGSGHEDELRAAEASPFWKNRDVLEACDVVHDLSLSARVHELCCLNGLRSLCTLNGISWISPQHPDARKNIVVVSKAAQLYAKNGWYAYKDTPWEDAGGGNQTPFPKTEVVRYGADPEFYSPRTTHGGSVLYVGRPHNSKGIELLLWLAEARQDMSFVLAWHASLENHKKHEQVILEEVKSKKLHNIEFIDLGDGPEHHERKRDLMAACGVFLHPAVYVEACASGIIEAQLCGAPVVAFDRGGNAELVKHGETGVIIPYFKWWEDKPRVVRELGSAISVARQLDPIKIRAHALQDLTSARMAREYVRLYERVADRGSW